MRSHRSIRSIRAGLVTSIVATLLLVGGPAAAGDRSPLRAPVATPAPEPSPFTASDAFCVRDRTKPPAPRRASAPGVTARDITIAFVVPRPVAVTGSVGSAAPDDPTTVVRAFGDLVNRCGGILGRTVDVDTVTQSGDARADCARVAAVHAFVVVSATPFAGAACVAEDLHTIVVSPGDQLPNAVLRSTQGRAAVGASTEGVLPARVLDLVESGRLDRKRVLVVATQGGDRDARSVRRVLATAAPTRRITVVTSASAPRSTTYDVVISTAFAPAIAALAHNGPHPVSVYALGDVDDAGLDAARASGTPGVSTTTNAVGIYGWMSPDQGGFRTGARPTRFATNCNEAYAAARPGAVPSSSRPSSTTAPRVRPGDRFLGVADVCLAWRVTVRAMYNAGADPTERTVVRALYRLPFLDNARGGPTPRPNQVIVEPPTRVGIQVFLARAEYPCVHPAPPRDGAVSHACWVPVAGWENGHAVSVPLVVRSTRRAVPVDRDAP